MIKDKTKIFKALSDPNRLRILKMLQVRPLYVCELTDVLGLAASTVSQHLSILKEAGFIVEYHEGKWVNYKINAATEDKRISSIISQLDFWLADEESIIDDIKKAIKVDRFQLCSK